MDRVSLGDLLVFSDASVCCPAVPMASEPTDGFVGVVPDIRRGGLRWLLDRVARHVEFPPNGARSG